MAAVGDAALLKRANHLRRRVPLLALVQAGLAALAQLGRLKPIHHKQSALDAPKLLQRQVELVLALVGSQALQHGGRQHGAGL